MLVRNAAMESDKIIITIKSDVHPEGGINNPK